jgi:hypothetical protein
MGQKRADSGPGVRQKVRQKKSVSIRPLRPPSLGQRHLTRFVPEHRSLLVLVRRVNVTFHDSDRVVAEDLRERSEVDLWFAKM